MKLHLIPLALLAAPLAAQTATPKLPPELQTGLRCAALFSVVSAEQARQGARDWPPITQRGREFFVRISARAMDAGKLDRPALQALMRGEVAAVRTGPGGAIATRRFESVIPGVSAKPQAIAPALNRAANAVAAEVAAWVG